jgi:nitrite reductase/ring-hydroxylating ferredoxin subunit
MQRDGRDAAAFVIRYDGKVHAYLNSCAHIPVELDWMEGEFFDKAGLYLVCATHGATYEPATGHCIRGPCKGQRLIAVPVDECNGEIILKEGGNRDG